MLHPRPTPPTAPAVSLTRGRDAHPIEHDDLDFVDWPRPVLLILRLLARRR